MQIRNLKIAAGIALAGAALLLILLIAGDARAVTTITPANLFKIGGTKIVPLYPTWSINIPLSPPTNFAAASSTSPGGSLSTSTAPMYFQVVAINGVGTTTVSTELATTTRTGGSRIHFSWTASPGATGYAIFYSTTTPGAENAYQMATTTNQYDFTSTSSPKYATPPGFPTAFSVQLSNGSSPLLVNGAAVSSIATPVSIANGGTGTTTWQTGSIPFYNGTTLTENNSHFYWDNTNNRLGISSSTPMAKLTIAPSTVTNPGLAIWNAASSTPSLYVGSPNQNGVVSIGTNVLIGEPASQIATTSASALTLSSVASASGITLYNTADQSTNYERIAEQWTGNVFKGFVVSAGGSGTVNRQVTIADAGGGTLTITSSGLLTMSRGGTSAGPHFSVIGTLTASNVQQILMASKGTVTETGTAGYTSFQIQPTESTLGSGAKLLIQAGTSTAPDLFDITNTGYVGIASSTPGALLSIAGSAGGTTPLLLISTSTSAFGTTTVFSIGSNGGLQFGFNGAKTGIATTTPAAKLDIYTAVASTTPLLLESISAGACIIMQDVAGGGYTQITTKAGTITGSVHTGPLSTCN